MNTKHVINFFKKHERIFAIVGPIVVIGLAIGLPYLSNPSEALLPKFALAQLALTATAFYLIFITLYFTILQVRKSMAKPKLEVIFSETGNSETRVDIPQNKEVEHNLKLSVINKGNAITKLFQIDFKVPTIFNPRLEPTVGLVPGIAYAGKCTNPRPNADNTSTISYYSNEQVYCFVNVPAPIHMLTINTRPNEYNNYPSEFRIKYRVYGDWAETQEGELKIRINKQAEVT